MVNEKKFEYGCFENCESKKYCEKYFDFGGKYDEASRRKHHRRVGRE